MPIDRNQLQLLEAVELRRRAEERLKGKPPTSPWDLAETHRLLHELQVHQIELEMQNSELRQARNAAEKLLEQYTDLYDFAPVGYLTLDREGIIRASNLTVAGLLKVERSRTIGRRFELFVSVDTHPFFSDFLGKVFASQNKESCEVTFRQAERDGH